MFGVYESRKHLVFLENTELTCTERGIDFNFVYNSGSKLFLACHIMHNIVYIVNERIVLYHMLPKEQARSMVASFF